MLLRLLTWFYIRRAPALRKQLELSRDQWERGDREGAMGVMREMKAELERQLEKKRAMKTDIR